MSKMPIITKTSITPSEAIEAHRKCCLFYTATPFERLCTHFVPAKRCKMDCSYIKKFINKINE